METTIYIEKPLTDKVLEGLEDGKNYFVISDNINLLGRGKDIKQSVRSKSKFLSHVLLPLTVTSDMVEKEAEKGYKKRNILHYDFDYEKGFEDAVNWLLNLNKEGEK